MGPKEQDNELQASLSIEHLQQDVADLQASQHDGLSAARSLSEICSELLRKHSNLLNEFRQLQQKQQICDQQMGKQQQQFQQLEETRRSQNSVSHALSFESMSRSAQTLQAVCERLYELEQVVLKLEQGDDSRHDVGDPL